MGVLFFLTFNQRSDPKILGQILNRVERISRNPVDEWGKESLCPIEESGEGPPSCDCLRMGYPIPLSVILLPIRKKEASPFLRLT